MIMLKLSFNNNDFFQTEANNNNIIIAQLLLKQITDGTNRPLVGDIDERFCHVENDSGILLVRTFAQLLLVTPHGLTTLEILDALTMSGELDGEIIENSSISLRLHSVIDKLGFCIIICSIIFLSSIFLIHFVFLIKWNG